MLEQVRVEFGVPGLAAAIVRGDRVVAAATGVRRAGRRQPIGIADRFHVGSVSKPISATVIATLVDAGLIDWSTTVSSVFPDLAGKMHAAYRGVTLEQLLSHRAGILAWEEDHEIARAPPMRGTPR